MFVDFMRVCCRRGSLEDVNVSSICSCIQSVSFLQSSFQRTSHAARSRRASASTVTER